MRKRLQVTLDDAEFDELYEAAARDGITTSEWVRRVLRQARRERGGADPALKLAAIRAAARHSLPTADIDQMLAEHRGRRRPVTAAIDSIVPMYLVGAEHANRSRTAQREQLESAGECLVTDAEMLREIVRRYTAISRIFSFDTGYDTYPGIERIA